MPCILPLSCLTVGQSGIVYGLSATGRLRRRLQDLGMVNGRRVYCVHRSVAGDPAAYVVCRTVFALRKEDAALVTVQIEGDDV